MVGFRKTVVTSAGFARFEISCSRFSRAQHGRKNSWTLVDRGGWKNVARHGLTAAQIRATITAEIN